MQAPFDKLQPSHSAIAVAFKGPPATDTSAIADKGKKPLPVLPARAVCPGQDCPLVSVVIPAYNAASFITRTLASVSVQTYQRLEILVVDDGSCDRTPEIVKAYAQKDPRIKLLQQPNAGVAAARNFGIQSANGEFIAPIDADDVWHPEAMAKVMAQFLTGSAELGVVYTWSADIDEHNQQTGGFHAAEVDGDVYKTLICHNFLGNASSTVIRKACLDQVGGYDQHLKAQGAQGCEDWDLYLRLAEHYSFAVVPEFLVGYRKVLGSMSGDFRQMAHSQRIMLDAVQQKHPEIPGFLYRLSRSSFYLYLAHQCDKSSHVRGTLFWLRQAVKIDPITPFIRLGLHALFFRSVLLWLSQKGVLPERKDDELGSTLTHIKTDIKQSGSDALAHEALVAHGYVPTQLEISRSAIWLKVSVGRVLHRSLSRV